MECIWLHYSDPAAETPLGERLAYYADFLALFGDFDGYVRHFLLDDLVTEDRGAVLSLMSGEALRAFGTRALAVNPAHYAEYRRRSITFVKLRNARIRQLGLSTGQPLDAARLCSLCSAATAVDGP